MRPPLAGPSAQIADGLGRGRGVEASHTVMTLDDREDFRVDEVGGVEIRILEEPNSDGSGFWGIGNYLEENAGVNDQHSATRPGDRRGSRGLPRA